MAKSEIVEHEFTKTIRKILGEEFGEDGDDVFGSSALLGYLNLKTRSANRGSKARGAFANHYALYVVIEDYIKQGYFDDPKKDYSKYEGARFSDLFKRQRELPFGAKLQNHGLNSRLNDEFKKFYSTVGKPPIVRDVTRRRYWIHTDLITVQVRNKKGADVSYNIAGVILKIIDAYVAMKKAAFEGFIEACRQIAELGDKEPDKAIEFVSEQLKPHVDARVFEIVSYAVLKAKFGAESVWIGDTREAVAEQFLALYKTGRTNANDGGIDFVMKPLGRFFQVTESIDVNKYFLDLDKVHRFPMTFVVKSDESSETILAAIREQASAKYKVDAVVDSYIDAVEEIINVNDLVAAFEAVVKSGQLQLVMDEIVAQSKLEFNFSEDDVEANSDLEELIAANDDGD